ncbi:T9SS type A sorting domain-containing protein [Pedobacter cryophilus]|uniref:T9SS type A sorting domain-containing protein n=1 Tax=Pedobacter cryophilus TaxID=2571271 RepID=A0A4U1BWB6_9SPHI|nr:T9SS type A sorting domain-containing protein [Pedobacter cryophilus]TKB96888.1 T9SS type A sorting domain-containing protein [Pedobacter cryophilus]
MKKFLQFNALSLMLFIALAFSNSRAQAQVYASWNMFGQSGFGVSPLAPTVLSADAVATEGLTRSANLSTASAIAAQSNRWGGETSAGTSANAISTPRFFTFAITPAATKTLSFGSISAISLYLSSNSAISYLMQYSLDGTAYTDITTHSITRPTTSGNQTIPATDLSAITALQGVTSATTVYFRIVPFNAGSPAVTDFNFVYFGHGTNTTAFSVNGPVTLPVKLSSFTSSIQNQAAFLKWTTESEVNFDYFSVEKRDQNSEFREIGRVAAKGGNGKTLYSFSDKNISFETSYYRLKMVDKDGTFEYSDVIDEALISSNQALSIWPNPAVNQNAKVAFKELSITSNLKVIDLSGRVVINQQLKKGTSNIELDLSKLNNGQFVLLLESNGAKLDYLKFLKEN